MDSTQAVESTSVPSMSKRMAWHFTNDMSEGSFRSINDPMLSHSLWPSLLDQSQKVAHAARGLVLYPAVARRSGELKETVHDQRIHIAQARMEECFQQRADHFKAEALPQT